MVHLDRINRLELQGLERVRAAKPHTLSPDALCGRSWVYSGYCRAGSAGLGKMLLARPAHNLPGDRRAWRRRLTRDELHAAAMALPGTELDIKWGSDHCYCVGGKMFCATDAEYSNLGFKATEIAFEALTSTGRVTPSKYLA